MKTKTLLRVTLSAAVLSIAGMTAGFIGVGAASAAGPKITVTPSTNLVKGEKVAVTGTGFTPGDTVYVVECIKGAKGEAGCDIGTATPVTITSAGKLPKTMFKVITGKLGSGKCATAAGNVGNCEVSAGNASGGDSAVKDITFKKPKK